MNLGVSHHTGEVKELLTDFVFYIEVIQSQLSFQQPQFVNYCMVSARMSTKLQLLECLLIVCELNLTNDM